MWAIAVVIASLDAHIQAGGYGEFIVNEMADGETIPTMEGE